MTKMEALLDYLNRDSFLYEAEYSVRFGQTICKVIDVRTGAGVVDTRSMMTMIGIGKDRTAAEQDLLRTVNMNDRQAWEKV